MQGHKCDRCGEFEPECDVPSSISPSITFGYQWESDAVLNSSTNSYDLCNECRNKLVDWIELGEQ